MKKIFLYTLIFIATLAFVMRLIYNYASAETTLLSNYVNVDYYKQPSTTSYLGTRFIIPGGGTINKFGFKYCRNDTDTYYQMTGFIASTTGTTIEIIATSTNVLGFGDFSYASSKAACIALGPTATEIFYYDDIVLTAGKEYAWLTKITYVDGASVDRGYLLNDVLDNDYDVQEGTIRQDNLSQWFYISYAPTYTNVEVVELPEWDGEVYVGSLEANIPQYIDCFLNQTDCVTWVKYNFDHVGDTAYLIPYVAGGDNNPDTAIASSTLTLKLILKEEFTLPTQTTATTTYYCVFIDDTDDADDDKQLCFTTVYWTDEDDLGLPVYDIESACDDVATSSGSFGDDFRYGLECAFRKVLYWSFTPHPESIQSIRATYEDSKENFPISIYQEYQATFEAVSEYEGTNLTIPFAMWKDQYTDYEPLAEMELSSTTLMTMIDEDFYDQYYFYAQIFIYLLGVFYIFFRVYSLSNKQDEV